MPSPSVDMASNEAFVAFLLCSTALIIKMYMVAVITGQVWLQKKASANPEDAVRHGGPQYCCSDPDVEHCLRAHQNDMERPSTPSSLGLIYSFLGLHPFVTWMHFLIFLAGRIVHTMAYLGKLWAPICSLAYVLAQPPCLSITLQIIWEVACTCDH